MQRIGRINRIGSSASKIYSYHLYPSTEGDNEIHLYRNALIKLQGFHSAFGEDAKIFSHEELLENFELFEKGAKEDVNEELNYLRIIREFKNEFPDEFKRINELPLKAKSIRNNKYAINDNTKNSTIVFLKSQYKKEYYQVIGNKINPIKFIETANILKAEPSEQKYSLPPNHHNDVEKAMKKFEKDFYAENEETTTPTDKADADTRGAVKYLRDIKPMMHNQKTKDVCQAIYTFISDGTHNNLPKEIMQISKKITNLEEVENQLLELAKKYSVNIFIDNKNKSEQLDANITPKVVLAETFYEIK
jgi:hypothetical protein